MTTIAVDWDVKQQTKQTNKYLLIENIVFSLNIWMRHSLTFDIKCNKLSNIQYNTTRYQNVKISLILDCDTIFTCFYNKTVVLNNLIASLGLTS